jgi:hypothetical protein
MSRCFPFEVFHPNDRIPLSVRHRDSAESKRGRPFAVFRSRQSGPSRLDARSSTLAHLRRATICSSHNDSASFSALAHPKGTR